MKLTGTVLRCSARKVNSSGKETRGRTNGHRRREQKRRGARVAGRHSAAAAKGSDGGGPGHRDPRCGVGSYRSRRRKRKTVNLRRDFRLMQSRQRFL